MQNVFKFKLWSLTPKFTCRSVVSEIGPGVRDLVVGDRVAVEPGVPCWTNRASRCVMYCLTCNTGTKGAEQAQGLDGGKFALSSVAGRGDIICAQTSNSLLRHPFMGPLQM